MVEFLLIMLPSLLSIFLWKLVWKHELTMKELAIAAGVTLIVSVFLTGMTEMGRTAGLWDTEILNGFVEKKYSERVSCEHSYQICVPVCSGKTCSTQCTTYYEHSYDIDWVVKTSVGSLTIDRVSKQGLKEPPRYTKVEIGEPASLANPYMNYLKADSSLLHTKKETEEEYKDILFKYPNIKDYYRVNTVFHHSSVEDSGENAYLRDRMKTLGADKQVNIVTVFTDENPSYYEALLSNWGGVKKNDVLMVFGMKDGHVNWFKSTSFADGMDNRDLHVALRINALGKVYTLDLFKSQVDIIEDKFTRLPNEKFAYLLENLAPPTWLIILNIMINLSITALISYKLATNYEREY